MPTPANADGAPAPAPDALVLHPGAPGEKASPDYGVSVNGKDAFVHTALVRREIDKPKGSIWTHKLDAPGETASFVAFDFDGTVKVRVRVNRPFKAATIHPLSLGIKPEIDRDTVEFSLSKPDKVTLMLDGSDKSPLHFFVSPPEKDVPRQGDANVLYFGPGVHRVGVTRVADGQTVYIAGGAIVYGQVLPDEKGKKSERTGLTGYAGATFLIDKVKGVRIRGRGIIDGSEMNHGTRSTITAMNSSDLEIEGVIIRDAANWCVNIRQCENVRAREVKIICGRLNSDGINPVGSKRVRIGDCFIRNHDDSIAVKATNPEFPAEDIVAERCVIWNDWGYALGVTYETRAPISNVTFRDCDVLDVLHWALGIHVVDSATISNITFENIRVERTRDKLVKFNVTSNMWGTDKERGRIRDVLVKNVRYIGRNAPGSQIEGFDADHLVQHVTFEGLMIGGKEIADAKAGGFKLNEFTKEVVFKK